MSEGHALGLCASRGVEHHEIGTGEGRNENPLAVGREFQPIGAADARVEALDDFPARDVDDRDAAVLCVRRPELAPV
jgi:hypothetical protein